MHLLGFAGDCLPWNFEFHNSASAGSGFKLYPAPEQFGALPHRDQTQPPTRGRFRKTGAAVGHVKLQCSCRKVKPYACLLGTRMTRHVVQSFLQDAIDMDSRIAADWERSSTFLVGYANSRLPFHHRQIPLDGRLQAGFVEHDRMQRLRKTADFVQCTLRDLADLKQFRANWRVLRRHPSRSTEHRANRSQNRDEFIVQFTRDVTERRVLS